MRSSKHGVKALSDLRSPQWTPGVPPATTFITYSGHGRVGRGDKLIKPSEVDLKVCEKLYQKLAATSFGLR